MLITDPYVIAPSRSDRHLILRRQDGAAPIPGAALAIGEADPAPADVYEAEDYRRIEVTLTPCRAAFLYVAHA